MSIEILRKKIRVKVATLDISYRSVADAIGVSKQTLSNAMRKRSGVRARSVLDDAWAYLMDAV